MRTGAGWEGSGVRGAVALVQEVRRGRERVVFTIGEGGWLVWGGWGVGDGGVGTGVGGRLAEEAFWPL